jgi:hypothetical protein
VSRSLTRSELAEESAKIRGQKALMYATITPGGSALVNCPYCLLNDHTENPVDVTRFIDNDGKREHTVSCSKGHTLRFKSIDEWRERRILAGIQAG